MNLLLFSAEDIVSAERVSTGRVPPDRVAPDRVAPDRDRINLNRPEVGPPSAPDTTTFHSGLVVVRGRRTRHLREVLGAAVGDFIRVGLVGGAVGEGQLLALDESTATLSVTLHRQPPDKLPLTLILALPRPKMLRRILRSAAETGVREVHLINSFRVEKSFWQSPAVQSTTLEETLLLGLEQAGDTVLPDVSCHRRFKPFVEDRLPDMLAGQTPLLAQPGDHPPCPRALRGDTLLVIGPEGGFIPYEVDKLRQAGCKPVSLGPRILRVETAIAFALGRLT